MNLSSLIQWSSGIILGLAAFYHVDDIHWGILRAQAQFIYDSRSLVWGQPNFLQVKRSNK